MILFFSGTGNTRLIAEKLAERLGDESLDLLSRIKEGDYSEIRSERPFVICSPVYVSELPVFLADYLRKVSLTGSRRVYGVLTNGGYSGIAGGQLAKIFRRKKMEFRGYTEFRLPSNHITNRSHRETGDEENAGRVREALAGINTAAAVIESGGVFRNRHLLMFEYLITVPVAPVLCYINQGTEGFWVRDNCTSCGKCARLCPLNVIEMQDGRPVWKDPRCAHCMSCIQNCPVEAIEYKKTTEGRKRYSISRVKY